MKYIHFTLITFQISVNCVALLLNYIVCIIDKSDKLTMRRKALDWSWKYFFLSIRSNQWAEFCSTWRRFKIE